MKTVMRIIFVIVLLVFRALAAETDEVLFDRGNTLYEQGAYQDALHQYAAIAKPTVAVWYNRGNAAYRMGKWGMALACWRSAQRQAGWRASKDLYDNIELVRMQAREKAINIDQLLAHVPWWWRLLQAVAQPLRSVPTSLLQLLCLLFGCVCIIARGRRRQWFIIAAAACIVSAGLLSAKYAVDGRRMAVVVSPRATLFSGPGNSFCSLVTIPEATEVYVAGVRDGFCKVQVYGLRGWIESSHLQDV